MAIPDDMIGWKDLATTGAVLLSGMVAYLVNIFTHRLETHEAQNRETFAEIFKTQQQISAEISKGFRDLDNTINTVHIKMLERISDVQQTNHDP